MTSKKLEQAIIKHTRPDGMSGKIDRYLPEVVSQLRRLILQVQEDHQYDTCKLEPVMASHLAAVCVEFAEDIHCGLGLWRAMEHWNRQFFQTPLPFMVEPGLPEGEALEPFDVRRVQYLVWHMVQFFKENEDEIVFISPNHEDLEATAMAISAFLEKAFARMPVDSGVGQLFKSEDTYAYQVKRKLVWLGTSSYLFRYFFQKYAENSNEENQIAMMDDFICQSCTHWSGLGALEILAEALELEGSEARDLLSWSDRYLAAYEITECHEEGARMIDIKVRNLVNDQDYVVQMDIKTDKFGTGSVLIGSLVTWREKWYWSGTQNFIGNSFDADARAKLRDNFFRQMPRITYRYCPDRAELAGKHAEKCHRDFLEYYGDDLAIFEDGLAMAASEKKRVKEAWDKESRSEIARVMEKHDLDRPEPNMNLPEVLLNAENGVAVFSDPMEGVSMVPSFYLLKAALEAKSEDLSDEQVEVLHRIVECTNTPPAYIRRLVSEFGGGSFLAAFHIRGHSEDLVLEYLLRCHKGEFFRRRYPDIQLA